jgi:hypothetical protein
MATVRPFPENPQLVMNPVLDCSINTQTTATNNLISDITSYYKGDTISDLGNLYKSSNVTLLKNQGILDAQLNLAELEIFLSSNLKISNFENKFNCEIFNKLVSIDIINNFTIGKLNNN